MKLRVLTLNCWGLPHGISKDKNKRMRYIAEHLSTANYDLVSLQEVWDLKDYHLIQSSVKAVLPHSHYFMRGYVRSGLCTFSKWPIIDVLCHPYSLNGYAHKVLEMDWYACKMAAMCRMMIDGLTVNVFLTHAHALYAPSDKPASDAYLVHRLVQLYELSELARLTAASADLTLVTGDFNSEPFSLAVKLALANAGLVDAWEARENTEFVASRTIERPGNEYTAFNHRYYADPEGERVDYVTYLLSSPTVRTRCAEVKHERVRETGDPFSDHEAVAAVLELRRRVSLVFSIHLLSAFPPPFPQPNPIASQFTPVQYLDAPTNERLDNDYAKAQTCYYRNTDNGERIDYIAYQSSRRIQVRCLETRLEIPARNLRYSDHEAVVSTFAMSPSKGPSEGGESNKADLGSAPDNRELCDHLTAAMAMVAKAEAQTKSDQISSILKSVVCFLLLFASLYFQSSCPCLALVWTCAFLLLAAFFLHFGVVVKQGEKNALADAKGSMKLRLTHVKSLVQ